jgi:flagellar protein FliL
MAKKEAAPAPANAEAKPAGKMKLIIIIVIAVLLAVGLSVGGTWFFLSKKDAGAEEAKAEVSAEPAVPVKQAAIYEELSPAFVVNFNHQGRARYMQVSVHMPVLRNRLVMLFSGQDFGSLLTPVGKEMLRQQATASVQELAEKETGKVTVEQVLFTNLVLQ